MKVLIVEDEKPMALEMESFLNKLSYSCELAFSGRQAREKMPDQTYSFVLLDLGLPDMDGLQLGRWTGCKPCAASDTK